MTNTEQAKLQALNGLTKEVTAFSTWDDFKKSMQSGYVPSIYTARPTGRMTQTKRFQYECRIKLVQMVRAEGFRVYDGVKVL